MEFSLILKVGDGPSSLKTTTTFDTADVPAAYLWYEIQNAARRLFKAHCDKTGERSHVIVLMEDPKVEEVDDAGSTIQ